MIVKTTTGKSLTTRSKMITTTCCSLKLTFAYQEETYERTILIPHRSDDVPLF